jgi:hypothetical protein
MKTLCSDAAELAANAPMTELANFRIRSKHEVVEVSGRVRGSLHGSMPLSYSTTVGMVAITEGFVAAVLRAKVEATLTATSRITQDAQRDALQGVDSTWDSRLKYAKRWFGIDGASEGCIKNLLAFAEARNSIVHGMGRLTRRQLADDSGKATIAQLGSVGILVQASQVIINDVAVTRCAEDCRRAVLWMDEACRRTEAMPSRYVPS